MNATLPAIESWPAASTAAARPPKSSSRFYGELRVYFLGVEDDEALRNELAGKREYDVLPAGDRARRQGRKISGTRDADIDRRLPRLFPGDARRRVAALGDIDQLDERIDMVRLDVGGRRHWTAVFPAP